MKKKILIVNEFSQLSTGFSTYMRYLLPILHATGKYEIAELATYVNPTHSNLESVPWTVFPNEPNPSNQQEMDAFKTNPINQFGLWQFTNVLLQYQPDIVIDIRDPWMCSFINQSPLRKNFKYIHMPTCDGEPQKLELLHDYSQCDLLLTYSEWAKNVIEKQSGGKIKVFSAASPGPDLNIFKPMNKGEVRKKLGLQEDLFIVNTVMRNQPRKLYPELFMAFSKYLELCRQNGREDLANKSFLYCHTSYPDVGWHFAEELNRYKISHKVLFTYMCDACQAAYPTFFNGEIAVCRNCRNAAMHMPNTTAGVSREKLAEIMACADIYIQYSVCEGFGMPLGDAKSCGVPVMAVDYSAMSEQTAIGGIPIKIERMFQEPLNATNQWRALPDNNDCAEKLFKFASSTPEDQAKLGLEARECMEKFYNWDRIADIWMRAIDSLEIEPIEQRWLSELKFVRPNVNIPNGLSHEQFVEWCYRFILNEPFNPSNQMIQRTIAALNLGYELIQMPNGHPARRPVDRNVIVQSMLQGVQQKNQIEQIRYDRLVLKTHERPQGIFMAEI